MKSIIARFYTNLFLGKRLIVLICCSVVLFLLAFFLPWMGDVPYVFFWVLLLSLVIDIFILYRDNEGVFARRNTPERLSNGDENPVSISIESRFLFNSTITIIDEIPFQFQRRDVNFSFRLGPRETKKIDYQLKPLKRGEYDFGKINVFVQSPLALIQRRFVFNEDKSVPVYPSFLQMRKYEIMAVTNRLSDIGIKKIRRIGHSMEFEQVKNYVQGDDYRTINWKATARRSELMVNSYTDEKSQHVYCVIDKSRAMKMPFEGLSLLDYAINASLVLANIALLKEDKAGLITVSDKVGSILPADGKQVQMNKILEVLHKEKTRYLESNMEALYLAIRHTIKQRSLVVFFTNFESMSALERQLPFLKKISRQHLLLIVFFENTELRKLSEEPARDVEEIYVRTIAEKFAYEKRQIVLELAKYGIQSILSTPQNLTINTINRYLEIKARQIV